ncbi:LPS-assembly lipoprotein LptE [Azohydromonas aeria]|uniref:LPS-assembly lipoprotein LptE n=1 Tax=Azohydromonas aeria TaxID=2590212 RepID=UPI001E47D67A|nr:LPS assembly lipoprotein LptE [Azohydromonas aeria]
MMKRRSLLLTTAATAALPAPLLLGGCGFAPRRPQPLAFQSLALVGFAPRSPMAATLLRSLPADVTVVDAPQQAQVVLESLLERRERAISVTTGFGQVREFLLRVRFTWRLSTRAGKPLVPPTELLLTRANSYNEQIALAKEQEQVDIYQSLEEDMVQQVLRRLEGVREL